MPLGFSSLWWGTRLYWLAQHTAFLNADFRLLSRRACQRRLYVDSLLLLFCRHTAPLAMGRARSGYRAWPYVRDHSTVARGALSLPRPLDRHDLLDRQHCPFKIFINPQRLLIFSYREPIDAPFSIIAFKNC